MLLNNRIIYKDAAVLNDYTVSLNDLYAGTSTIGIVAADDALYLGSDLPFNHRYFDIGTANDQASVVSVDLWDGNQWVDAVDVIDQTAVSGRTLAQSGIISWVPDRYKTWSIEETTEDISDLSTLKIYDLFWVRLNFSADLKATTSLKYVGHKFSNDDHLASQYPDLLNTSLMSAYETGKTDWVEQEIEAAEYIVEDLQKLGIIFSQNQILDWRPFKNASVHKTAEIIYNGISQFDKAKAAKAEYSSSLQLRNYRVDKNLDAELSANERFGVTELLTR